ncbi:ABC transporter substrate-binding protein [Litoreibacter arenae]|uniref:Oligopeptide ABC transporter, periplasmic oligopeptide-binding protein OppA n=1 Tax=Litoreibacter arenae DSM 19593 TaxID=1123360 RepID=S9RMQ2_9RHOB|nr:ABC transporter substrate-binding protein [Litoreibacter arenae]EPX79390.1 Oligopeptide ABC transporter, periplasmic oligopeptide-binding protein OppA [Litoreibacter arenae DSM 19593]
MTKHFKSMLVTTAVSTLLAFGAVAEEPVRGGTLIHAMTQTPRHLNPAVQSGIATGAPGTQLFAAPLRYDEDWTPQPYLAESWEWSEDGTQMTLKLVQGATFHDGEPITSEDVAFSVEVVKENHPFKTMFAPVTSVDTPDEHTAVLNLSQPHPALLLAMSSQLLPIIPKHIYGDGEDVKTHPRNSENVVGSGPFKLVEFKPDQHVIVERYDDFFMDGRPYLDKIVYRIIKDASSRAIGLENGELHMSTFENTVRNLKRMSENENLTVTPEGYAAVGPLNWLAFNVGSDGPLADKRVRQAIAYAIDKNFILNAIMLGLSEDAKTGIHPGSPLYNPDVNGYDLDVDKANALLDEAGYERGADGTRFSLTIDHGNPTTKPQAEFTKAALSKVGIDVTVNSYVDFPTWAQKISNHNFDMTWDTVFNWGDPVIGVHRTYSSDNIKPGVIWSNTQQYSNPKIDALMEEAGREIDPEKRRAMYNEFQEILAEDLPVYWTNTVPYHTVYSNEVGNPPLGIWASGSPYDLVYLKQ